MDQDRQIRFAIPPFFLFASLLWGAYLGDRDLSLILKPDTAKELFSVLAAAVIAIVPLGFLISTISVLVLRIIALVARTPTYEARLKGSALDDIWRQVRPNAKRNHGATLFAVATFDHELLAPGIHTWLMRRWNAFNVSTHSCVALLLAHAVASAFRIPQTWRWSASTAVIFVLLIISALNAWRETMAMLEFQAQRLQQTSKSSAK